jgi:uncharacterized protein (DUF4415 family)
MAIIKSMVKVGQKPSVEELARIKKELQEAKKYPINLADCPELPSEALKEFAVMSAERNRQKKRQTVTIRLDSGYLSKYKALGKGYTSIMADVLTYAVDNPEFLTKITTK